jgi:hypothetical protein
MQQESCSIREGLVRTAEEWTQRPLGRSAALVLGWRRGSRIEARRLNLAREMNQELRQRAQATLVQIGQRSIRSYDPAAQLEEDEVFLLTIDELPTRAKRRRPGRQPRTDADDEQEEASELVHLLSAPGDLDPIAPDMIRGQAFLFYAVVFSGRDSSIAFLKRHNPGGILKTGRVFGLFGAVVTRIEDPILVFESDFDLVVEGDELAALKPTALSRLFVDLQVAAAAVPAHIAALKTSSLNFTGDALDAIASACAKRRLLAGRLQGLIQTNHLEILTVEMVQQYVTELDEDPERFIVNGQIAVADGDVADLLDVLDQRHYRGGYDQLLRRADRNSVIS